MKKYPLRQNLSNAMMYILCALAVLLLVSCALPYSSSGLSSSSQAVTDVLKNPALRIPIFLAGLALLLAGLWLVNFIIILPGLVIGAVIGASIGTTANDGHFGILSVLFAIVAGAVGAWLAMALFYLSVFLSGFGIGFVVGGSIGSAIFNNNNAATTIGIILGIIGGILAVTLWKYLQIVISSGMGAALIGASLGINDRPVLLILIWLIGIIVQSGFLKVFGPPKRIAGPGRTAAPPPPVGPPPASQG